MKKLGVTIHGKRILLLLVFLCLVTALVVVTRRLEYKEVVYKYFEAINEQDQNKMRSLLTYEKSNTDFIMENIKTVVLDELNEVKDDRIVNKYLEFGRGKEYDLEYEDIKIVSANFYIEFYNHAISPLKSGTYFSEFIIVKLSSEDNWLIDDWNFIPLIEE